MHPGLQLLLFFAILLTSMFIGALIGLFVIRLVYGSDAYNAMTSLNITSPNSISALWILQFASTTLPVLATPVFFAYVVTDQPQAYLHTTFRFKWLLLAIVLGISMCAFPVMEVLTNLNHLIPLPSWLKWLQSNDEQNQKTMMAMMNMKGIGDLIYNVLFIGLLTAVAEEFAFRGCLQTIFERWTKNIHAAIWITAIIFSAFHLEYFGFLPRVFLGVMFGYFVAWSGSIWTSVWAHFLNNATIVVLTYLYQNKSIKVSPDDDHVFNTMAYLFSFIIIVFLFAVYRRIALFKKPVIQ